MALAAIIERREVSQSTMTDGKAANDGMSASARGSFVNRLAVRFGISNVDLNFSQSGERGDLKVPVTNLVTTPVHLASFSRTLSQTVDQYERAFGRIPDSPASSPVKDEG